MVKPGKLKILIRSAQPMDLDRLFFDEALQRHVISDVSRDVTAISSTTDALIGSYSANESPGVGHGPLRPVFMVDFCRPLSPDSGATHLLDFESVLGGASWGRLWIILTLIAISPSLFEAVRATDKSGQHAWLMGSSAPLKIPGFRERYFKALCGSFKEGKIESNCKTPLEIVTSELYIYSLLNGKQ